MAHHKGKDDKDKDDKSKKKDRDKAEKALKESMHLCLIAEKAAVGAVLLKTDGCATILMKAQQTRRLVGLSLRIHRLSQKISALATRIRKLERRGGPRRPGPSLVR